MNAATILISILCDSLAGTPPVKTTIPPTSSALPQLPEILARSCKREESSTYLAGQHYVLLRTRHGKVTTAFIWIKGGTLYGLVMSYRGKYSLTVGPQNRRLLVDLVGTLKSPRLLEFEQQLRVEAVLDS